MKKLKNLSALLLFIVGPSAGKFYAQTDPAQAAAETYAQALIKLLNTYQPAGWNKFINENFTKTSLARVPAESLELLLFSAFGAVGADLAEKSSTESSESRVSRTRLEELEPKIK